jgi:hypothetical protein
MVLGIHQLIFPVHHNCFPVCMENVCEIVWLTSYKLMFDVFPVKEFIYGCGKVKETPLLFISFDKKRNLETHLRTLCLMLLMIATIVMIG